MSCVIIRHQNDKKKFHLALCLHSLICQIFNSLKVTKNKVSSKFLLFSSVQKAKQMPDWGFKSEITRSSSALCDITAEQLTAVMAQMF